MCFNNKKKFISNIGLVAATSSIYKKIYKFLHSNTC